MWQSDFSISSRSLLLRKALRQIKAGEDVDVFSPFSHCSFAFRLAFKSNRSETAHIRQKELLEISNNKTTLYSPLVRGSTADESIGAENGGTKERRYINSGRSCISSIKHKRKIASSRIRRCCCESAEELLKRNTTNVTIYARSTFLVVQKTRS